MTRSSHKYEKPPCQTSAQFRKPTLSLPSPLRANWSGITMKLLTWMHRKFRQGGTETQREFPIGQPLLDDPLYYQKQSHANGTWRHVNRDGQARRSSFANLESTKLTGFEENASTEFSEYFEGFLAIGTLGTEAGSVEPETPAFSMSSENLAEGNTQVTENELRQINDELEKLLANEARDDGWTDSSGRNSHVSNGRISHASTITLSGKPLEISESTPLQEYLLRSSFELPGKAIEPKKENRTSLGELFEKHKTQEISETKRKRGQKRKDKETERTAMNLMKKVLKKKMANAASKSLSGTTRGTETTATDTKLNKILHKFQKRVHPECLTASAEKPEKSENIRFNDICNGGYYKDQHASDHEDISNFCRRARRIGHMRFSKSHPSSSQFDVIDTESNESKGCWIKTDADYLVLEL